MIGCALGMPPVAALADPLQTAEQLANSSYTNTPYGDGEGGINCTTFVFAVLQQELKSKGLSNDEWKEIQRAVNINYGWSAEQVQQIARDGTDPRLGGVHYALVQVHSGLGESIQAPDARPGDFIQYWKKIGSMWIGSLWDY